MSDCDVYYWATRAAEEKQIAASLPDGRAASIHRELADLYEQALRREGLRVRAASLTEVTDALGSPAT